MSEGDGPTGTMGERVERELRQQIATGALRPGDRLRPEQDLSSRYGVSRNTMREVVRALAAQGLLVMKRGVTGGTFVATPSPEQVSGTLRTALTMLAASAHLSVSDLVQFREMVEVPAAELAALHRTDDQLTGIRAELFDPRTVDPGSVFAETRGFHMRVLRATGNPLLEMVADPVFGVLDERFRREQAPAALWQAIADEHREIIGYLEIHDQAGAREATRAHLRTVRSLYETTDRERPAPRS